MCWLRLLFTFWLSFLPVALCSLDTLTKVYDDVLDSDTASWLHGECVKAEREQTATDVGFAFPLDQPSRYSFIEQILNQILLELYPSGDRRFYVEYWMRSYWMLVRAHQDMDEAYAEHMKKNGKAGYGDKLRHPETGHVLYLKVGSQVRGPTVVFNETRGGDFSEDPSEMVVVPAVEGRLTRFKGNMLHAVPRPAQIFWTLRQDSDSQAPDFQRSVLLFNLWPMEKEKPQGIVISDPDENDFEMTHTCQSKEQWKEFPVEPLPSDPSVISKFMIPLMGDAERRGTDSAVAKLQTQTEAKQAFAEKTKVTSAIVRIEEKKPWFSFMGYEF